MHRLFVAVRPPRPIIDRLIGLMGGISAARWQSEDQLHLTLRFIGEADRHQAQDIHAALSTIRHAAFEVTLRGLGAFERRGQPEVLWIGVGPQEPLKVLHKKIDQALVRTGLDPERRAYTPHITLARLKRGSRPVTGFLQQPVGPSQSFTIDAFALYESRLTPGGAVCSAIERYPLA